MAGSRYRFGDFRLDLAEWRLEARGEVLEVQQKVLDLLAALVERPGSLWSREELHAELWPDARVSEDALFQVVRKARQALGDDPRRPSWIATVPGRGYRFVGEVTEEVAPAPSPSLSARPTPLAVEGSATVHRVPIERDAFVGRTAELAALRDQLLGGAGLVTLTGPGGGGKTRLAVRAAAQLRGRFPGGVRFCDLSEAMTQDGVVAAVGRALDILLDADPVAQVGHVLASRPGSLLVLDNVEQVLGPIRALVDQWRVRAAQAAFLVTSRENLGLAGEHVYPVPPLDLDDAVALFVARAGAARSGFALTDDNRPTVVALVELLDGLPLALELAAARIRVWSPETLLDRMAERFRVLSRRGPDRDRHATLQATFDWGWALLEPWERAALGQLAIFEGGFDLQAAEAVLVLDRTAPWAMDVLHGLVDRSWVQVVGDDRMDMLLSVREYVAAQTRRADRGGPEERHGQFFAALGHDDAIEALDGPTGAAGEARLTREQDNLVVACRRALARGDQEVATATLRALVAGFRHHGVRSDVRALVRDVVAHVQGPQRERALLVAGVAYAAMGPLEEARALLEQARGLAGDDRGGYVDIRLGSVLEDLGELDEAEAHLQAGLDWARRRGAFADEGRALNQLGVIAAQRGQPSEAQERLERALALHERHGQRELATAVLNNLGLLAAQGGRHADARERYHQALERGPEPLLRGALLSNLGVLEESVGRVAESREAYARALAVLRGLGRRTAEANALANLGELALRAGALDEAEQRLTEALRTHVEVGNRRSEAFVRGCFADLARLRGDLAGAGKIYAQTVALAQDIGELHLHGQLLVRWGRLEAERGALSEADAHFQQAFTLLQPLGDPNLLAMVVALQGSARLAAGDAEGAGALLEVADGLRPEPGTDGARSCEELRAALQRESAADPR